MRIADYIFKQLADWGAKHVFLVTGGGAMHLNDALGREERLQYICNLHEQACAMAAEGYARISGQPGIINVTTGPGGTNAITGVMGAWVDSIPMLIISGQVKTSTCISSYPELNLRSLGDQEINIIDIVKPITKYAVMLTQAEKIRYELEKAWFLCQHGRPGPVWLDIPLDIQAAEIDISLQESFIPDNDLLPVPDDNIITEVADRLKKASRPVIIAGAGVTLAKGREDFTNLVQQLQIPVLTSISGVDLIPSDSEFFYGRPGILGERAANFIMQNCDLLLVIGTRMSIRIIGYAYEHIAREAFRIMVDADQNELEKPTFKPHMKINSDAGIFIQALSKKIHTMQPKTAWLDYCRKVKKNYPVILPKHRERTDYVSSYVLPEIISKSCQGNEIIVTGNGTAYTSTFQAFPVKSGMRMFSNMACASMGYGLPAAIGAAFAGEGRQVICITGDGSLQMNIQELQVIINYHLPIKIFVYNNAGYLSIKLTQNSFFNGHKVGSDSSSGIILPDLSKIAATYGFKYYKICNNLEAEKVVPEVLSIPETVICEVMTDPLEELEPKAASKRCQDGSMISKPLEDLFPFLPREEFSELMLIKPVEEPF